jgi:hypothetical protein
MFVLLTTWTTLRTSKDLKSLLAHSSPTGLLGVEKKVTLRQTNLDLGQPIWRLEMTTSVQ